MKRKLLFCVVFALLLAITPPAFAGVQQGVTTTITAICNLPEIVVTVPATASVFINPYRLPVTIAASKTDAQIISTPACIENKSEVPLSVTVTLNCEVDPKSDMRLVTSSTKGEDISRKYAFIYFEIQAASSSNTNQVNWDSEFDEERHIIVRDGETRPRKDMVTIDQADRPNHFAAFRLTGDCVPIPRDPWTEDDKIGVSITFSFTPLYRQET